MGNITSRQPKLFPIDTTFKFPSPLPSWPPGEGFASGIIDLGGLEVCQITSFKKIWSTNNGSKDTDVTFFEPSPIPDGFSMLGCYCQPNGSPLFGWVLAGKDVSGGTLAAPVDYTLVWSSKNSFYVWLPTPPEGYRSVGYAITTTSAKPSAGRVWCVRADLTDESETDGLLWSSGDVNVYGLRAKVRGRQAQGVSLGTFLITKDDDDDASVSSLSCLKNNNFEKLTSSMPNLAQINALIREYSPRFYFHPKEKYFPASTKWYFTNGVQLYHAGEESNPTPVDPTGSNLPQDGSNDGTYWLDLPVDETERERVKKGDLQSCEAYLHVKPMLGATFTDLAIWVFYPFNGPSTAKLGLVDIPLGRVGEHIGDWEHVTLRVSNFNGNLYRVYFAQHSTGTWVNATSLEFLNTSNNFAAYTSLNGHATYPVAGLVLQGTDVAGIKNDTAKSDKFFDVKERYSIMAAEYMSDVVELPWVNFKRKWGPKITYERGVEIQKLQNSLGSGLGSLLSILPREFSSEDGPTGPKLKVDWDGDER